MAAGEILCPVDGLLLGLPDLAVKLGTDLVRGCTIGRHVHLDIRQSFTCPQGHTWRIQDNLLMERVS